MTAKKSDKSVPAPAGTVIILCQERAKKIIISVITVYVLKAKLVQQAVSALCIGGGGAFPACMNYYTKIESHTVSSPPVITFVGM
jgi:hypothetical protein